MRLTLIRDGDIGTPVGEENLVDDHPDKATLQEALDSINEQAQTVIVDEPAAAAKAQADAEKAAQAEAAKASKSNG